MTAAAIVTGGAGALGQAIGRRLVDAGEVLLVDLEETGLRDVAEEVGAAHLALDLVAPDSPERIQHTLQSHGWEPRVLVNNAGINRDARASDMSDEDFRAVVAVDLVAPARLALGLRPHMRAGSAIVQRGLARGTRKLRPGQLLCREGRPHRAHPRAGRPLGARDPGQRDRTPASWTRR